MKNILLILVFFQITIAFSQTKTSLRSRGNNQDFCIGVNDGGSPTDGLCIDGPNGTNVGIGTPAPVFGSSDAGLHIKGATRASIRLDDGTNASEFFQEGNHLYINNLTANNISLRTGGTTTRLKVDGGTGKTELSVRTDANCGIGDVCSGNGHTHTESDPANLDPITNGGLPSCGGGTFIQVGNTVQHAFRCGPVDVDVANIYTSFKIDLPQVTVNFASDNQVLGTCETEEGDDGWIITAIPGVLLASVYTNNPTDLVARSLHCNVMYHLQ